ncbi:MAG TPA: porin [Polyangiaceae bacterium]|nr:porin [Polyangiaceae bacterium]
MRGRRVVTSVIALGLSVSAQALAQGAPKPAPAPAPAPPPGAAPAPAPPPGAPPAPPVPAPAPAPGGQQPAPAPPPPTVAPAPPPPAESLPPAPPPPVAQPTEPPPAAAPPVVDPPADPEPDLPPADAYVEGGDAWYDLIEFSAFIDAYASVNFNSPKPQYGKNKLHAHDANNGFSLSWVGINASYPADPVGGTMSLRFGPTAQQLGRGASYGYPGDDCSGSVVPADCDSSFGMENVKQAFASWKPGGSDSIVQLDLGKFDTPFGVEVAESHLNLNYTRSLLYWLAQPSFHTGLRANFAVADAFDFRLLAVNGWNNTIDNNVGKTFGAQGTFHLRNADGGDVLTASLGYMIGPEHEDTAHIECAEGEAFSATSATGCVSAATSNSAERSGVVDRASSNTEGLRHLIDLVVVADPIERLRLVLNADFGIDNVRNEQDPSKFDSVSYWGVLLGGRVSVVDQFGIALRGEYLSDPKGYLSGYYGRREKMKLISGTLTLELLPADFLTIRLDNRIDWADKRIFDTGLREDPEDMTGTQFTTTLGVVAHTY